MPVGLPSQLIIGKGARNCQQGHDKNACRSGTVRHGQSPYAPGYQESTQHQPGDENRQQAPPRPSPGGERVAQYGELGAISTERDHEPQHAAQTKLRRTARRNRDLASTFRAISGCGRQNGLGAMRATNFERVHQGPPIRPALPNGLSGQTPSKTGVYSTPRDRPGTITKNAFHGGSSLPGSLEASSGRTGRNCLIEQSDFRLKTPP